MLNVRDVCMITNVDNNRQCLYEHPVALPLESRTRAHLINIESCSQIGLTLRRDSKRKERGRGAYIQIHQLPQHWTVREYIYSNSKAVKRQYWTHCTQIPDHAAKA
jgi:hypothetical protein